MHLASFGPLMSIFFFLSCFINAHYYNRYYQYFLGTVWPRWQGQGMMTMGRIGGDYYYYYYHHSAFRSTCRIVFIMYVKLKIHICAPIVNLNELDNEHKLG
jgi:hypothetical protein